MLAALISVLFLTTLFLTTTASADPGPFALTQAADDEVHIENTLHPLGDLLAVPATAYHWGPESTDEALAVAVILGNDPDLERRNPFRKRNFDLFRAERPLVIGQNEMVLRLRVRAKTSKLMSLELHF